MSKSKSDCYESKAFCCKSLSNSSSNQSIKKFINWPSNKLLPQGPHRETVNL